MLELWLVAVFVILLISYYFQYRKKWLAKFGQLNDLPGPPSYPLIGNLWMLSVVPRLERMKYIDGLFEKYGSLFKMWAGNEPIVICGNAEDAEIILSSRSNIEKSVSYDLLKPWLGNGLLTSGGSKWHQRKKLLTPAFHFSILESFLPIMAEHSRIFVEKLSTLESKEAETNIFPFVQRFAFDVICETAMGVRLNVQNNDELTEYLEHVLNMTRIVVEKGLTPWWHYKYLYSFSNLYREELKTLRILHAMSMNVIQKNKQKRLAEKMNPAKDKNINDYGLRKRKAFLDLLLDMAEDSQTLLTDEDVREEVDTFMFGGHDTTTSAILSTIHFLSTLPKIQDKVAKELFSVFGDSDRDPSLQDISELKYLDCVIKESLRLLPPAFGTSRQLSESVVLGGKYLIPVGTHVRLDFFRIHRQETNFSNPLEFDPNNFAPENIHRRHPFAYLPFSAGARNCVGQKFAMLEEKVLLSSLLRKYEIRSSQKLEDLKLYSELVLRHDNGVFITLTQRTWETM